MIVGCGSRILLSGMMSWSGPRAVTKVGRVLVSWASLGLGVSRVCRSLGVLMSGNRYSEG